MEIEIPNGRVMDRPALFSLQDDPANIFGINCLAAGYQHVIANRELDDPSAPDMRVRLDTRVRTCALRFMNLGGRGLVILIQLANDETAYLYVREGRPSQSWDIATKMLVLPSDSPGEWGVGDEAAAQRNGRVMLYVALVTLNGWLG